MGLRGGSRHRYFRIENRNQRSLTSLVGRNLIRPRRISDFSFFSFPIFLKHPEIYNQERTASKMRLKNETTPRREREMFAVNCAFGGSTSSGASTCLYIVFVGHSTTYEHPLSTCDRYIGKKLVSHTVQRTLLERVLMRIRIAAPKCDKKSAGCYCPSAGHGI